MGPESFTDHSVIQPSCVLPAQCVEKGCLDKPVFWMKVPACMSFLWGRSGDHEGNVEWKELVLVLCLSPALQAQSESSPFRFWELLLTTRPGIGWVHGLASPTGVALLLLLLLMFVCSSPCIRRSGHFEVTSPCPSASPRLGSHLRFMPCPL